MTDDLAKRLDHKIATLRSVHKTSSEFAFYHHTADLIEEAIKEIKRLEERKGSRMTRAQAITAIDETKNRLINPVEMLRLTWVRVILAHLTDEEWERALIASHSVLSA